MAMNFWNVAGEDVRKTEIKESAGSSFTTLPEGWYLGAIEKITLNDSLDYGKSIRLILSCKNGSEMQRTSVKLNCWAEDDKKRRRAIQMMILLFQCAKKDLPESEPDEESLSVLVGRRFGFSIGYYELEKEDGSMMEGNWLMYVDSVEGAKARLSSAPAKPVPAVEKPAKPQQPAKPAVDFEDDIPF